MGIEQVCRHFKLMQQNCDLDINFPSRDSFVHKREKVTVYLNFDDDKNIGIKLEQEKMEEYVDSLLPRNSGFLFIQTICDRKKKALLQIYKYC